MTERKTANKRGNTGRGSGRGRSRLLAEDLMWSSIPELWGHALSRRQMLNDWATEAPHPWLFLFAWFDLCIFSPGFFWDWNSLYGKILSYKLCFYKWHKYTQFIISFWVNFGNLCLSNNFFTYVVKFIGVRLFIIFPHNSLLTSVAFAVIFFWF